MSLLSPYPFATETAYRAEFKPKFLIERNTTHRGGHAPRDQFVEIEHPFPYKDPERYAKIEQFREQVRNDTYWTQKYLSRPLDPDIIENSYQKAVQSAYTEDFCSTDSKELKSPKNGGNIVLPPNWVTPVTTQQCSYRKPTSWLAGRNFSKVSPVLPNNNLGPNLLERKILGVKTEESDYQSKIGQTGTWIIRNKIHGDVSVRPTFDPEDLQKAVRLRKLLNINK